MKLPALLGFEQHPAISRGRGKHWTSLIRPITSIIYRVSIDDLFASYKCQAEWHDRQGKRNVARAASAAASIQGPRDKGKGRVLSEQDVAAAQVLDHLRATWDSSCIYSFPEAALLYSPKRGLLLFFHILMEAPPILFASVLGARCCAGCSVLVLGISAAAPPMLVARVGCSVTGARCALIFD